MPEEKAITKLGQRKYVTLVMRLLVGPQDEIQGTLVDMNEKAIGQFRQLDKLPDLIKHWLKQH